MWRISGKLLWTTFDLNSAGMTVYADDATLYHAASTCYKLNLVLSRELYAVYDWIKMNELLLNISKTQSIALRS